MGIYSLAVVACPSINYRALSLSKREAKLSRKNKIPPVISTIEMAAQLNCVPEIHRVEAGKN